MKSPFEGLQIDPALALTFFAGFARFEYAMKASRFCRGDRHGNAQPNWYLLEKELGAPIEDDSAAAASISYLVAEPPLVQKYVDGQPVFQAVALAEGGPGTKAIEAVKRVRNNLFHGGKHTPHSSSERDNKLIQAALNVLEACLKADAYLRAEFDL
jgi:hypothetical protein